jgi:hypothetical protein
VALYSAQGFHRLSIRIYDILGDEGFEKALHKLAKGAAAIATANTEIRVKSLA